MRNASSMARSMNFCFVATHKSNLSRFPSRTMGTTASIPSSHHGPPSVSSKHERSNMTKVKHVKDPYHKHGNSRSCFNPKFLLHHGMPGSSSNSNDHRNNTNMTVLMQLILLQDWQRVLIRACLFGHEVSRICTVKLFQARKFRVLPLHVACALDPPPQVIEALLVQPSSTREKRKQKKNRVLLDDEEQAIEASAVPPPPLAAVPVVCAGGNNKSSKRKQHTGIPTPHNPRHSWTKALAHTIRSPRDDQEQLLQQKGSSSVVDIYCDDDESVLESRLASNGSMSGAATDLYAYSMEAATLKESPCYISPENSIGDPDGEDDDSICSTAKGSGSLHSSCEDVFEDDNDDAVEVVAQDSSILGSFLEQHGVVLQLTTSGNIQPLELPVQQLKQQIGPEEWSTIEPKHSGASSSISHTLSQQSSIFSDENIGRRPTISLDAETFFQALAEEGSQSQLLAIHIACLYHASAAVLKVLSSVYPEGALAGIFGMLPIHLVAANWKLPPIPLYSIPAASSTPSGMPSSLLYSELGLEDLNSCGNMAKKKRLQVLMEATPESLLAKSVCHGLRPLEYIQLLVDSKTSEGLLKNEEASLFYLEDEEKAYRQKRQKTATSKSTSDACSQERIECDRTNSSATHTSTTIASSVAENTSTSSSTAASFAELLQQGSWEEAMVRLETDHTLAREWHYGIEKYNPITGEPCTLWKRLPLHIVCAGAPLHQETSVPFGLVQLLIQVYPEALRSVDPHTGMIPLHLACRSSGCASNDTAENGIKSFASVMFQVIHTAIKIFPHLTKVIDSYGRLPLHHAVMVGAPYTIVERLVRQDPGTVLSPDQNGVTPLSLAQKTYPADDSVMSLMELAWL